MALTKIYVELPHEVEQFMADNRISLQDVMDRENIDCEFKHAQSPYPPESGSNTRDLVLVIIAGAAVVTAISSAISTLVSTAYRKPYFVEYEELEEVRDKDSSILLDPRGNPVFKTVKKHKIVEPLSRKIENYVNIEGPGGIVLRFGSKESPSNGKEMPES